MAMTTTTMYHLPDVLVCGIMEFVGEGQYLYVAFVSRGFRKSYLDRFPRHETLYEAALETVDRAKLTGLFGTGDRTCARGAGCLDLDKAYEITARDGRLEVLRWLQSVGDVDHSKRHRILRGAVFGGHVKVLKFFQNCRV